MVRRWGNNAARGRNGARVLCVAACAASLQACGWDSKRAMWLGKRFPDRPPQQSVGCGDIDVDTIVSKQLRWSGGEYSGVRAGEPLFPHFEHIASVIVEKHGDRESPGGRCRIISDHFVISGIPFSTYPEMTHYIVDIKTGPDRRIAEICVTRNEFPSDRKVPDHVLAESRQRQGERGFIPISTNKCFKRGDLT